MAQLQILSLMKSLETSRSHLKIMQRKKPYLGLSFGQPLIWQHCTLEF